MKSFAAAAVALSVLAAAAPSAAQQPPEGVPYSELYFNDELIEQELLRPDLDQLYGRRRPPYTTLIKIRGNFVPEMLKSAESL